MPISYCDRGTSSFLRGGNRRCVPILTTKLVVRKYPSRVLKSASISKILGPLLVSDNGAFRSGFNSIARRLSPICESFGGRFRWNQPCLMVAEKAAYEYEKPNRKTSPTGQPRPRVTGAAFGRRHGSGAIGIYPKHCRARQSLVHHWHEFKRASDGLLL